MLIKPNSVTVDVKNEGAHKGNKSSEKITVSDNTIILKGKLTPGVV